MYGGIILGPKHFEQIQMFCFGSIRCPFSFGQDPQVEQGYHLPTKKVYRFTITQWSQQIKRNQGFFCIDKYSRIRNQFIKLDSIIDICITYSVLCFKGVNLSEGILICCHLCSIFFPGIWRVCMVLRFDLKLILSFFCLFNREPQTNPDSITWKLLHCSLLNVFIWKYTFIEEQWTWWAFVCVVVGEQSLDLTF